MLDDWIATPATPVPAGVPTRAHITKHLLFPRINDAIVTGIRKNHEKPLENQRSRDALGHHEKPYKTL